MEKIPTDQKESSVSRVVGFDEESERGLLKYFKEVFENDQTDAREKEKPAELDEMISRVNTAMVDFLEQYGVKLIDIPPSNIHILDRSKLNPEQSRRLEERYGNNPGLYIPSTQGIVLFRDYQDGNKLPLVQTIVHEILHMESFNSFQKTSPENAEISLEDGDKKIGLTLRRTGFSIGALGEKKLYFNKINEAIITELAIRFERTYFGQWPELTQEIKDRKDGISYVSRRDNIPIEELEEEVASVRKNEDFSSNLFGYGYLDARQQLRSLVDDLYEKNKPEFKSKEEVFNLFARATMTGRLLQVARLIEMTFGKGSFREIGEKSESHPNLDSR